jgi:exosome complex component RRP46
MTITSTLVAVGREGSLIHNPQGKALVDAESVHSLTYSSNGELLLTESEGNFTLEQWEKVVQEGAQVSCPEYFGVETGNLESHTSDTPFQRTLKTVVEAKIRERERWRENVR